MRALTGLLNITDLNIVNQAVDLMFDNPKQFKTPEAYVVYTQRMLDEEVLMRAVEDEYGMDLVTPPIQYIPQEIIDHFENYQCIPIRMDNVTDEIHIAVIPELVPEYIPPYKGMTSKLHYVPIHYYIENYSEIYGQPEFLRELPPKDIFDIIVSEAVNLGAADITIAERSTSAVVYYNVKKRRVESRRKITKQNAKDICSLIASSASMSIEEKDKSPIYPSIDLDTNHRGRVVINRNYHGMYSTMRVLPNKLFDTTLEQLNLTENTRKFMREKFMSDEKGLRIMIGPTYSGKNTTAMSVLKEKIRHKEYKTVSVEFPVELVVEEIEQIPCETEEEFELNCGSLLRQNPDIAYITEMGDTTATMTMNIANTGKVVISSLHANSIADCVSRIQDLTGLSTDRIVQNLQSAVYQELVPVGDNDIKPITTCLHFSQELKDSLIGLSLGEITKILREEESKWVS